jgi:multidrug efflux pump subunit AcrB
VLLSGVARFLFTPLALSVVYAMLTSYLLSRTLAPTMAFHLLPERHQELDPNTFIGRFLHGFEARFERLREAYASALKVFVTYRTVGLIAVGLMIVGSLPLMSIVGEDFFPSVDAGMMRLHVRAPTGTRIERTEQIVERVEQSIRKIIPPDELESISDNIGVPTSYDLAYYQTDSVAAQDADVLIQLKPKHRPTEMYENQIRRMLPVNFPQVVGYFEAADIVSQVLNFGLPAAIDLQISGSSLRSDYALAAKLKNKLSRIPGLAYLRIAEPLDYPAFKVDVDRTKALEVGVTEQQVASSLLAELYGATLLQPNFWLNPVNGVNYSVIVQAPYHLMHSVDAISTTPITPRSGEQSVWFRAATLQRRIDQA